MDATALQAVCLDSCVEALSQIGPNLNNSVGQSFQSAPEQPLTAGDVQKIFTFRVPKVAPGGACSLTHDLEAEPFNLALTSNVAYEPEALIEHKETLRLWRLKRVLSHRLQQLFGC